MHIHETLLCEFLVSHPAGAARLVECHRPEDAASVLEHVPAPSAALLSRLDAAARALRELMTFPPGSAGSLMDTRVPTSHWLRVTLKEASVGVVNGVAIAAATSLGVYLWSRSLGLSLVLALAMVISMAIAGVTGALIPLTFDAAGQDPAQSSSIVLTTVTDVTGFFSFPGLATLFASML